MMDITKLKITNFLAIGDAPVLNLKDQGLVLIQGENEDDSSANSNGVGKSSIVDALCWAIYGSTARDETGDAVVNNTAKKDCSVEVEIQDGATSYQIIRYRKHKEFKNQTIVKAFSGKREDGPLGVDMSKGTERETQEVINGIMGCSLDVFMAAIYAGQEVTPDLPKMTDKQLKLLIEEAAGVERLETAYEVARGKLNSATALLSTDKSNLTRAEERLNEEKVALETAKLRTEEFEKGRPERAAVFRDNADGHKTLLIRIITEVKGLGEAEKTTELASINEKLGKHGELLKQASVLRKDAELSQRSLMAAQVTLDALLKDAKKFKFAYDNAETEVKKACPSCGKLGDDHDVATFKAHNKEALTKLIPAINEAKSKVADATAQKASAEKSFTDFDASLPDVSELTARNNQLNIDLRNIANLKNKAALTKKEYDRQIALAESCMTDTNPHAALVTVADHRVKECIVKIDGLKDMVKVAEAKTELYTKVAKVFSPAGVRAHILDSVTPFLNDRTADYLSALSDGNISATWNTLSKTAKGELREKFNIDVTNDKGAKSFKGLSGGEKRKVRLSTMLALQDMVASRASKPIRLWLGDEIDDALDKAGLERLMGVLERKARERGTVLVVSHSDLRDWCDKVTTVTKRGGLSTIDGAICG